MSNMIHFRLGDIGKRGLCAAPDYRLPALLLRTLDEDASREVSAHFALTTVSASSAFSVASGIRTRNMIDNVLTELPDGRSVLLQNSPLEIWSSGRNQEQDPSKSHSQKLRDAVLDLAAAQQFAAGNHAKVELIQ
jgi:hypothetical protein